MPPSQTLTMLSRWRAIAFGVSLSCMLALLLMSEFSSSHAQATLTITPSDIKLRVGGKKAITLKDAAGNPLTDATKITVTKSDIVTYDADKKTFSAQKSGSTTLDVVYTATPELKGQVKITVEPALGDIVIKSGPDGSNTYARDGRIKISQGAVWPMKVVATDTGDKPISIAKVTGSNGKVSLASDQADNKLTATTIGESGVKVEIEGLEPIEFKIDVIEPVATIETRSMSVEEGAEPKPLELTIKGTRGTTISLSEPGRIFNYAVAPNHSFIKVENGKVKVDRITTGRTEKVKVTVTTPQGIDAAGAADDVSATLDLEVVAKGGYIEFQPRTQPLLPGGTATIRATIRERDSSPSYNKRIVDWVVEGSTASKYVELSKEGNTVTVIRKDPSEIEESATPGANQKVPSVIAIKAIAQDNSGTGPTIEAKAFVQLSQVTKFMPMKVKLNVMDYRTASDLYGKVTADEYYVLLVRLFNDLMDEKTNEYTGDSILAYSGSIEVAVQLQKQFDKGSNTAVLTPNPNPAPSPAPSDGKWYPLTSADLNGIAYAYNGPTLSPTPDLKPDEEPTCKGTITYRPLTFEMMVNTVDRRDERSFRARTFQLLSFVGTAVSFGTAVAVPGPSSDLPLGLEKYSNLLVPGMEKLFPSLKEQQRQNVVSQTMKPIEEIPFGADVTRVLFLPKKSFRGMLEGHKVRISQICPYYFKARVAIIKKGSQTEVEQGTRSQ